jgi:hypothetical protein
MIELNFVEFHDQNYVDQGFCLYIVKNEIEGILYIGISTNDIWERWFGWGGHMTWDGKVIYGESLIAKRIESQLPDSLKWIIQLWTLEDCWEFCRHELPPNLAEVTVHDVEPIMIRKLSPALNAIYNLNPGKDTTPKGKNEIEREQLLDPVYKELYDKESAELPNWPVHKSEPPWNKK